MNKLTRQLYYISRYYMSLELLYARLYSITAGLEINVCPLVRD